MYACNWNVGNLVCASLSQREEVDGVCMRLVASSLSCFLEEWFLIFVVVSVLLFVFLPLRQTRLTANEMWR